jgi:hypothetical protein
VNKLPMNRSYYLPKHCKYIMLQIKGTQTGLSLLIQNQETYMMFDKGRGEHL